MGGLGNQMFQYAYAKNLSILNKDKFYLDTSFYNHQVGVTPRVFSLNSFPKLIINLEIPTQGVPKIIIDNFIYDSQNIFKGDCFLDGYWQSEKYFKESKNTIIDDFSPDTKNQKKLLEKYPQVTNNSISLHIRRTDYLTSNGYHPVQTLDYYNKAIDILGNYENIFIFSDDISWCKENLSFNNMLFVEGNTDVEDLWLMSLCEKNIIVNSSFSWWGAYLNKNRNKKVIAPSRWFGDGVNLNTQDILPEEWIKI
tara:strand:- start:179 stop:937 length:759 start_codon:yes stop_codon:yes gene_type:complete